MIGENRDMKTRPYITLQVVTLLFLFCVLIAYGMFVIQTRDTKVGVCGLMTFALCAISVSINIATTLQNHKAEKEHQEETTKEHDNDRHQH